MARPVQFSTASSVRGSGHDAAASCLPDARPSPPYVEPVQASFYSSITTNNVIHGIVTSAPTLVTATTDAVGTVLTDPRR